MPNGPWFTGRQAGRRPWAAARLKVMLGDEIPRRMHWPGSSHRGYLPSHQALRSFRRRCKTGQDSSGL